jgi:hypothetical protein
MPIATAALLSREGIVCNFEDYLAGFFERYLAQVRRRLRSDPASHAGACPSNDQ